MERVRKSYVLVVAGSAIAGVILGFRYIIPLIAPFLFGYFIAWLAAPIVTLLQVRFRMPRTWSSLLIVTLFLFLFCSALFFLGRALFLQVQRVALHFSEYEQMMLTGVGQLCVRCDRWFHLEDGMSSQIVGERMDQGIAFVQENVIGSVKEKAGSIAWGVFDLIWKLILVFISAMLIVKEYPEYKKQFQDSFFYKEIHTVTGVLSNLGIAYLKAQFILMCITAAICTIGLFFMGNHYALLIGVGIAVFDAFPVLGSAFILIPWAIIELIGGRFVSMVILIVIYVVCQLSRQILEPKLVGDRIGIMPVYTLISMYVGLKLYGAFGFILGPISLVAIKAIIQAAVSRMADGKKAEGS